MKEMKLMYRNEFGLGFYWMKSSKILDSRIQLVFRDMGFYLTLPELQTFIELACHAAPPHLCNACPEAQTCRSILVRTPDKRIDIVVNTSELLQLKDLLNGVKFHITLDSYLKSVSLN